MKIKLLVKEKDNRRYRILAFDMGYRLHIISFDDYKIAELLNCSVAELHNLEVSEYEVGDIYKL